MDDSVHQLLADKINLHGLSMFSVTDKTIVNRLNGSDFIFKGVRHNSQSIKSIEGVDVFWGEESQTFSQDSIDIIVPTVRKPGSQLIWTMNRLLELDPIYHYLVLSGMPNTLHLHATYELARKYGFLDAKTEEEIEHDRIHNPDLYQHKWLGQPMAQTEQAILSRTDVLAAMQRQVPDDGALEYGVDVARFGDDRSEFVGRKGLREVKRETHTKLALTELADRLEAFVDSDREALIKIDDTGVGGGLTDIMASRGYRVMAFNFGAASEDPDKYPNLISEAWFHLKSILPTISLSMDTDLLMELTSRKWVMDKKGRRGVESKDSYKKRGYRSPDKADATILCFYSPPVAPFQLDGESSESDSGTLTGGLLGATF